MANYRKMNENQIGKGLATGPKDLIWVLYRKPDYLASKAMNTRISFYSFS